MSASEQFHITLVGWQPHSLAPAQIRLVKARALHSRGVGPLSAELPWHTERILSNAV